MKPSPVAAAALWWPCLLSLFGTGCLLPGPGTARSACPVEWVDASTIAETSMPERIRMRLRLGEEALSLELVPRSVGDELVVVGLANYGSRLFVLRQQGTDVVVQDILDSSMQYVAIWIMDALHRSYWIRRPTDIEGTEAAADWNWDDEAVRERVVSGKRLRVFSRSSFNESAGQVAIEYPANGTNGLLPKALIENPWCGYDAVIVPIR